MNSQPIVIIDDEDDCLVMNEVINSLHIPNKIYYFNNSEQALQFLQSFSSKIFFILCEMHMPHIEGFMIRKKINDAKNNQASTIPFLFYSTGGHWPYAEKKDFLNIQGYFKKPVTISAYREMLMSIISYWNLSEPY